MKKKDLAERLDLRYATLLEWEKNRPKVYERLILSYEYEKVLDELVALLGEKHDAIKALRKLT